MEKVIFLHPVDLVDPFWHPTSLGYLLQLAHIGRRQPQTKNRPYPGLCGSKHDFERT